MGVRLHQPESQECAQILNLEKSSRCLKPQNGNASLWAEMQNFNAKQWMDAPLHPALLFGFVFVFLEAHIFANYFVWLPSTPQEHITNPAILKHWKIYWKYLNYREFRNRRKSKCMWCLSFADLFWFCYPDCRYCSNWFTSKTAFLTNSTELKEEVVPSTLFLNSSPCLSTVTIDSRCLKTSSILDTDFEEILIPDYQTSTKSILKDLRVKAKETDWNTALNQLRPLAKVWPLWASYLLFAAEFHTDLLNCDNFSTSHETPL